MNSFSFPIRLIFMFVPGFLSLEDPYRLPSPPDDIVPPPWDLTNTCSPLIFDFSTAAQKFLNCSLNYAIPPRVCAYCWEYYYRMKVEYERMQDADDTQMKMVTIDGRPCSQVIFRGYLVSYASGTFDSLTEYVWKASRCEQCAEYEYNREGNITMNPTKQMKNYEKRLFTWRDCIDNASKSSPQLNDTASNICDKCWKEYKELYDYYWDVYVDPYKDFCVDVQSTMNDSIYLWRSRYNCQYPDVPSRWTQAVVCGLLSAVFFITTGIFYAGSYIQGERRIRHLKKYSRLTHNERSSLALNRDISPIGVEELPASPSTMTGSGTNRNSPFVAQDSS